MFCNTIDNAPKGSLPSNQLQLSLMGMVAASKLVSSVLLVAIAVTTGTSAYLYQQASRASQVDSQNSSLQNQISTLDKQIDTLNSQISQLESLNGQLGGSNSQLTSQVQSLESQVSQLQAQVNSLTSQLTVRENLQSSRTIAQQVTLYRSSFGNGYPVTYFVTLGQIQYSGYLRVSWVATPRISFTLTVFEVNVTTPIGTSGVFDV